jgi:hypothetical protein
LLDHLAGLGKLAHLLRCQYSLVFIPIAGQLGVVGKVDEVVSLWLDHWLMCVDYLFYGLRMVAHLILRLLSVHVLIDGDRG